MKALLRFSVLTATVAVAALSTATAAPIFISGADDNISVPGIPASSSASAKRGELLGLVETGSVVNESFEGYSTGTPPATLFGGTGQFQTTGGQIDKTPYSGGGEFFGRFNTTPGASGNGTWYETSVGFTVKFGRDATAFGFYGTDFGDFRGQFSLQLIRKDGSLTGAQSFDFDDILAGQTSSGTMPLAGNGSLLFLGFYDDNADNLNTKYIGAVFNIGQCDPLDDDDCDGADFMGFDDLFVGNYKAPTNDAPEPGSLALVGLSLLGLAASRRRRTA